MKQDCDIIEAMDKQEKFRIWFTYKDTGAKSYQVIPAKDKATAKQFLLDWKENEGTPIIIGRTDKMGSVMQ